MSVDKTENKSSTGINSTVVDMSSRQIFTEISLLACGRIPKGSVPMSTDGSNVNEFWREVARYVVYEEIYDEDCRRFSPPQYPSISYRYFDKLCSTFYKDLKMLDSNAETAEHLMKDIVDFLENHGDLVHPDDLVHLEDSLMAPRWHPQVNYRQNPLQLPRLSVTGPTRRLSIVPRAEDVGNYTNKTLNHCLAISAECCSAMVGFLPYLLKPLHLLVRLSTNPPPKLKGLVEVDFGTRYVYLNLTPKLGRDRELLQMARCFASMLSENKFRGILSQAKQPSEVYKAAIDFRRSLTVVSSAYPDVINRNGGIDVPTSNTGEVFFEGADLVFDDYANDNADELTASNLSLKDPTLVKLSRDSFKILCPPFKELVRGIRILGSRIPSDYLDAFTKDNIGTVLSSILFIYFVVFAPSITFGTLMLNEVNESFNISLNIFASGVYTLIFSLFGGQPLSSIGPSGPGFIIETVIAYFASIIGANYPIYRFWVGIYTAVFGLILIALNLSSVVIYARRSLEELFSGFISLFLILKAIFSMFKIVPSSIYKPVDEQNVTQLQEALRSSTDASKAAIHLFLAFCMLVFCMLINRLKRSHFFRRTFRYWIGALNVPLGILVVSILNYIFFNTYPVTKLNIPPASKVDPKIWIHVVDFSQVTTFPHPSPTVMHGMAVLIAFFFSLLTFTETALNSVTALKPKAKKPSPFVMDHILTMLVFPIMSCILGWPFVSGVPVRTIANTMALVKVDPHPPPGKPAEIISLVEQRVSFLIVGILVTVSVFLGDILSLIPVAALYGMFIYLGINGLRGLDSINTLMALLTRRKYWGRWDFLTNLSKPQLAVIASINFSELAVLVVFLVLAEFTPAGYVSMATPFVLIGSGLLREFGLPRWSWLAPTLAKYDKRCLPAPTQGACGDKSGFPPGSKDDRVSSVETLVF